MVYCFNQCGVEFSQGSCKNCKLKRNICQDLCFQLFVTKNKVFVSFLESPHSVGLMVGSVIVIRVESGTD